MFSRLVANVSQTYWPLYLKETLRLGKVGFTKFHRDIKVKILLILKMEVVL